MSVITAKGNQAKENANKKNKPDLKKVMLRLKENESHKVRLLGVEDYVEYNSAGDYNLGIYNQPVTADSPLLVAHAKGGEKFKALYKKSRYVFVFGSVQTGELVAWDASKTQAKALISTIEEYGDQDVLGELAFNFKRTGDKTETVYSLNPIIKMKPEDKDKFEVFNDVVIEPSFYEDILQPKDDEFIAKLLQEAGFDIATHLPHITVTDAEPEENSEEQVAPIEETDEDLLDTI